MDTSDDDVTFTRAVTLGGSVDVDTTGAAAGNVLFSSTIATAGNDLALDGGPAGNVTLSQALTGGGNLTVRDGAVQSYAALTVNSLTIQDATTSVTFNNDVASTAAVSVTSGGTIVQTGDVTSATDLTYDTNTAGGTSIAQNGSVVCQTVDYDAGTTLGITNTINTTGGGAGTVSIDSGGVTTVGAGGDINAGGTVTFGAALAGALTTSGDVDTSDDDVTFTRAVTLTGTTTLSGAGITFASTIAGTGLDLTVTDTGTTAFQGAVGALGSLGSVTVNGGGTTQLGADMWTSGGTMRFSNPLQLAADVTLTDTGGTGIFFDNTVDSVGDGAFGLTVLVKRDAGVGVGAFPIPTIGFGAGVGASGGSRLKHLLLNDAVASPPATAATRANNPVLATIEARPVLAGGALDTSAASIAAFNMQILTTTNFEMGYNEKLSALGDLSIVVSGAAGHAYLGDLTALRNMTVTATNIHLQTRAAGQVLPSVGATVTDQGLDFVAGGQITAFAGTITTEGGFVPNFADSVGGGTIAGRPVLRLDAAVAATDLYRSMGAPAANRMLDIDARGQSLNSNLASSLASAVGGAGTPAPTPGGVNLTAALAEFLRQLGIYARNVTGAETIAGLHGMTAYDDILRSVDWVDPDHQVCAARLPAGLTEETVQQYRSFLWKPKLDKNGNPMTDAAGRQLWASRKPDIKKTLQAAADNAMKATGKKALSGREFWSYLAATPAESAAKAMLEGLHELFEGVRRLGLNADERAISRKVLLQGLDIKGLTRAELGNAIDAAGV